MKIVLYFDELSDALNGIQVIKAAAKFLSTLTVDFVSCEKNFFMSGDQEIFIHSVDELVTLDFDCVICREDTREKIGKLIPPEKILSPAEFARKFLRRPSLLFFTCVNWRYHVFAALYPIFALTSNPDARVEVGVSEYEFFEKIYSNVINFYNIAYPDKVRYTPLNGTKKILPNSVRFLTQPTLKSDYVYIGDADIFLLDENILDYHLDFMQRRQSDFSNVLRNDHQLTGLHFIAWKKMYPVAAPKDLDLEHLNDEVLLCRLMREKNLRFPVGAEMSERKIHGVHLSYFSRPPLKTLTTYDKAVDFPTWGPPEYVEKYLRVRYSEPVKNFTDCIDPYQIELRRLIQIADMWAFFVRAHPNENFID